MAEFTRLREDVERKGVAAKSAGQRKLPREEMCKYITAYAAAEEKWASFTAAGVQSCGIPSQIATQLKQVHANTEQTKEKICMPGPAPVTAPSLDAAPGTNMPATPVSTPTIKNNDASLWLYRRTHMDDFPTSGDYSRWK
jgi:hypothetical protein